ncbi:MAG: electron transfer flavoprotein subunit alpha/FixB family protein [Gemmatimonadetes bacterium]|nr:electron transfer flavoprotein subunit alpha/FixB family protein [Gemmatimonadota bacterium]MDA1104769.1 electron transfer flavoprotein subunit alpha/FixB family protein [Gemmatimonadota bacterium]
MADVLAFAELRDGQLGATAREAVGVAATIAESLGGRAHALVLGSPGVSEGANALGTVGAASIRVGEHEALGEYNPEGFVDLVVAHIRAGDYAAVVFGATTLGKDLAPRVAALLDVPLATDVTAVSVDGGTLSITRPVFSGKAFATLQLDATPAIVSIRPNVFQPADRPTEAEVTSFTPDIDPSKWRVRVVGRKAATEGQLDVSEASIIVSGGRGMKDPSNWNLLEGLRSAMGSGTALGASRAVVDAGWRPHGEQVGQTGKTVAPKLYVAVGISGAIQHLAGMRTAKTIVAINRDADAPIFGVADYGIVGDLFEVVPRLTEEIARLKAGD